MAVSKIVYKSSPSATPVVWMDATSATASAADIVTPNTAMLANGVVTTGTWTGAASNIVTGTFTGTTANTAMSVTVPYTGSGYPIRGIIYPVNGTNKSGDPYASVAQKYSSEIYTFVKHDISTAPEYTTSSTNNNYYSVISAYLYSDSDHTTDASSIAFSSRTAPGVDSIGSAFDGIVRFLSKTSMSVFIAGSSYGFKDNIEYAYMIVYSS